MNIVIERETYAGIGRVWKCEQATLNVVEGVVLMVIATVEDYGEDTCWLDFVMNGHLLINYDR